MGKEPLGIIRNAFLRKGSNCSKRSTIWNPISGSNVGGYVYKEKKDGRVEVSAKEYILK